MEKGKKIKCGVSSDYFFRKVFIRNIDALKLLIINFIPELKDKLKDKITILSTDNNIDGKDIKNTFFDIYLAVGQYRIEIEMNTYKETKDNFESRLLKYVSELSNRSYIKGQEYSKHNVCYSLWLIKNHIYYKDDEYIHTG